MGTPQVRYTTTSDGKSIAYSVAGEGPPLVLLPLLMNHVQHAERRWRPLLDRLRPRFRVTLYDGRGQGMSSRGLAPDHTMKHWQLDLQAVLDAQGLDRAFLLAGCHSGHVAVRFAIEHPERVAALLLFSCCVRQAEWGPGAFWEELPFENWELFLTSLVPHGTDPARMRETLVMLRSMVTQDEYRVFDRVVILSSVEDELPLLRTPTLVVHPRSYSMLRPEQGVEFASLIPDARFVLIDGPEDAVHGNSAELIDAIENFLGDLGLLPAPEPILGTEGVPLPESLTAREVEVLRFIAAGKSNREIADALVISVRTVERHIANLYTKIDARTKAQATAFAHKAGLV
jgi:pimeloyl-ACP methyl ester carboxylesterase/DNA-binding CsgD family transcriptional regulator